MKKLRSNGGYSLVYVVVAMTLILAIVGGLGLTASRNLASQQQAVDRLKARYDAAGKIEKIYGIKVTYSPSTGSPSSTSNPSSARPMSAGGGSGINWEDLIGNFWNNLDDDTRKKLEEWLGQLIQSSVEQAIVKALGDVFSNAFEQLKDLGIDTSKIEDLKPVFNAADKSVTFPKLPLISISSSEVGKNGVKAIVEAEINLTFNVDIKLNPISITCSVNNITYKSYSVTYSDGTTEEGADT